MRIGVLFGMEECFPPAVCERINAMAVPDLTAEFVQVGAVRMDEPARYRVIIDRISHDIPFYRAYLKNAVLAGTTVINNPFWWSADDKFFNYALATRLGVAIPPTVLLPHKTHPPNTTDKSMRNLEYPLKWDEVFAYVGFPAFLKPFDGGGWRDVYQVRSPEEFFEAYDQTGTLCMTLQGAVNFREYFRCYVIGQEAVHIMPYDPRRPHAERYVQDPPPYDPALIESRPPRCAHAVPRARLRPEHRRVRGRRRRALRDRLHEPGAGRRAAIGRPGQLRVDRERRRRHGRQQGAGAAAGSAADALERPVVSAPASRVRT